MNNHQLVMTMSAPSSSSRDRSISINSDIRPIESNRRTQNIPLPLSHKHRTQSEVQLCEDMETAEQRDLNMFCRLVNGIRERQMNLVRENESSTAAAAFYDPAHGLTEAERSLAHIVHTRNAPVDKKYVAPAIATTTSFKFNTSRRSNGNNFLNNWHANLNSGVPIIEDHPDPMHEHHDQQERAENENEWSVAGFDSSSNDSFDQQHYHHQQYPSINNDFSGSGVAIAANIAICGTTAYALPTLHTAHPSCSEMADEGMFDFEL